MNALVKFQPWVRSRTVASTTTAMATRAFSTQRNVPPPTAFSLFHSPYRGVWNSQDQLPGAAHMCNRLATLMDLWVSNKTVTPATTTPSHIQVDGNYGKDAFGDTPKDTPQFQTMATPPADAISTTGGKELVAAPSEKSKLFQREDRQKPKILVLFCGGTLIMKENESGTLVVSEKDEAISMLLNMEPRLSDVAALDIHYVDNIDSSNMSPQVWDDIGRAISEKYQEYDGFVITHGTDTMAYTASALSFVLGDLGKPVVITGSQIPGQRIESDARRNFVNAVRVAALDRAGVMLVFDGDIILGARSHKVSESKLDAFGPINWGLHGEVRIDIRFNDDAKRRHDRPLDFQPGFDTSIRNIRLFPGFRPQDLQRTIERKDVRGIILNGYGSGNISYQYLDAIKLARERGIAVVVTTQCLDGATMMHVYDVGRQALNNGAIQAYDMSNECIVTKLMWALNRAESLEQVEKILHTNFTGEINVTGKLFGAKT